MTASSQALSAAPTAAYGSVVTLSVLGGRAADAPNLILAGVVIAMIAPVTVFLLAQRYFVENVASSGLKG